MGRSPCSDDNGLKKGPWTPEEDKKLVQHIQQHGYGSWSALPKLAGLNRCGKSCRLRWTNYLRPDIKRGKFSQEEEQTILHLHSILGNKWSAIASRLPGRTDNEIKNFWNTHLKKKLIQMGFDPVTHQPRTDQFSSLSHILSLSNLKGLMERNQLDDKAASLLQTEAVRLTKLQYLQNLLFKDMEAYNLLNYSVLPMEENPIFNSSQLENLASFSLGVAGTSQPLHHPVTLPDFQDPQVPFSFQTPFNSEIFEQPHIYNAAMVNQGDYPPLVDASISNLGEGSSASSYGGDTSYLPELLFEDNYMHAVA